ncbi:hypothetical protein JYU34_000492 [Plutella xylostella]|uniref:Right handed beta helix domain-containing protein n=1 Tax=Plutella xylostella TaxID=51655 RepID=A0ABQ7R7U4_PLUXY|nr:hypothetical protein JYU34_000492 [Plutella xylostella]
MRWSEWWAVALVLGGCAAQPAPTVCHDESCRCDSFTRVICNCTQNYDEVTLRPDGAYRVPSTATAIIISGCARVYFLADTARALPQLRVVRLEHVRHVYLAERALAAPAPPAPDPRAAPGLRLTIHNCTVNEIASHAVKGRIDDISITGSRIHVIKPFAFSSLIGVNSIELADNMFDNIETQAFKKFTTENFILRGGSIRTLPSRFLSDVEVTNLFRMDGVTVQQLSSVAFLVNGPKRVVIESNVIEALEGDGFHISTRGPITFRNNTVASMHKGAFLGISVEAQVTSTFGVQELVLDNNTVSDLSPASLAYNGSGVSLRVDGLNLAAECSCGLAARWREVTARHGGALACWYQLQGHYVSLPTYVDSRCGAFKQNFWIFIIVGVVLAVLVAVVVVFIIVRRENEKKKKVQIVLPDGKTYRETEFHIVVERAELLNTDL